MLHSFQEIKYDFFLFLLQPTHIKFKQQQKVTNLRYDSETRER